MIDTPTRRVVLGAGAFAAGSLLGIRNLPAQTPLAPTPACHDGNEPTLAQTEGPFFKPSSPERIELYEDGMAGQPIELVGFVLTRNCKPIAGALLDFWQADAKGEYDNSAFRLARPPIQRRRRAFPAANRRPWRLCRPHPPCPRKGAAAWRPRADDATLFSGRGQESR
jgi:hypothetical protein